MKLKKFSFLLSATAATVAVPLVAVSCGKTATTQVTAQSQLDLIKKVAFTGDNQATTDPATVTVEQLKLQKEDGSKYEAPAGSNIEAHIKLKENNTGVNAETGKLTVIVSVRKGTSETPVTKELEVTGEFKKTSNPSPEAEVTAQSQLGLIKKVAFTGENQATTDPTTVTVAQLQLQKEDGSKYEAPAGSNIEAHIKLKENNTGVNAETGKLTVIVSVRKGTSETPVTKELEVTGEFKKTSNPSPEAEVTAQSQLDLIKKVAFTGENQATTDPTTVTVAQLQLQKEDGSKYEAPAGSNIEAHIKLKENNTGVNAQAGTLTVIVSVRKGTSEAPVTKEIQVTGNFLTAAAKKEAEVQAEANKITAVEYLDTAESAKDKVLPSAVNVTKTNFKAKENDKDYVVPEAVGEKVWSWDVAKVSDNDAEGKLTVKVTITFDGVTKESQDIVVEGFLTSDQKAVNDAKAAIKSADYADKASVLPSEVTDLKKFSVTQTPDPDAGITVTYGIVANSKNNDAGTLKVKATLTKGGKTAVTGELEVSGFLTTDQDNKNKADAKANELVNQTPKGPESRTWESVDAFVTAFNNSDASGQELRNGFKFDGLADGYRAVFKDGAVKKESDQTKATLKFTVNFSGQTSEEKTVDFTVPITPTSSS